MITEDYCSKEVLELLKAKGFVEFDGCVTHQAAMKWLRDVHGIFISIGNDFREYNWRLVNLRDRNEDGDPTAISGLHSCFCRYEEAVDDALKEAMARIWFALLMTLQRETSARVSLFLLESGRKKKETVILKKRNRLW